MKKKYWIILLIILIICIGGFFFKNKVKNLKVGNNKTSQEIIEYILNISSYESQITVDVNSNKNHNKYILKQSYNGNKNTQEVIEPTNIAGIKIECEENNTKIENSNLSLSKIIENYDFLGDNCLDLSSFIEDYKTSSKSKYEENESEIIMRTTSQIENIYIQEKKLFIDKQTYNPTKMEIKDNNQNTTIYILYNEVKLNSL